MMFLTLRRVQRSHFVQVLSISIILSGVMICWDKLDTSTLNFSSFIPSYYIGIGPAFRNDSFIIRREEAQKFFDHQFLLNHKEKCHQRDVLLLLLVKSSPQNFGRRLRIRRTWGNESYIESELGVTVKVLFVLGIHPEPLRRSHFQNQLHQEDEWFGDLIQQNFIDSFYNLTIKLLLQFHWTHSFCSHARFLMSADDDMFIHTPNLVHYLRQVDQMGSQDFWVGRIFHNSGPVRWKANKYYLSPEVYPWASFPDYTGGAAYVLSGDVASQIYQASLTLNASLHIDDVFMGICASVIGVAPKSHHFFSGERKAPNHPCIYKQMITSHGHEDDLDDLWRAVTRSEVLTVDAGVMGKVYCAVTKLRLLCNPLHWRTYPCKLSTIF